MDINAWLKQLGFDAYIVSFHDNEIDEEALVTLTAEDLKDLGVSKIGHRRKLMNAIATLAESEKPDSPQAISSVKEPVPTQLTDKAIDLWEAASKEAIARPAYDEGIAHLTHAIELLSPQVETGDSNAIHRALALQVQQGVALMARRGWGSIDTKSAFEKSLALADKVGETPMRFSILYGLMTVRYLRGDLAEAVEHGKEFVDIAEQATESAPAVVANRSYAVAIFLSGSFDQAQPYFNRALELFDPEQHKGLANQYGQDLGVGSYALISYNLLARGESSRAFELFKQGENYASVSNHTGSVAYIHFIGVMISVLSGDDSELHRHASVLCELALEYKLAFFEQLASLGLGLLMIERGEPGALEFFQRADDAMIATGSKIIVPSMRSNAGHRLLDKGHTAHAEELVVKAHKLITENGEYYLLSDLHRLEARIALRKGDLDQAEIFLNMAIAVAQKQGAKLFELRAAIDLARLKLRQRQDNAALLTLRSAYNKITEGNCLEERTQALEIFDEFSG